ncbi:hypothetical protein WR25_18135 [Diploscapter pachys]|uniref:SXP/RAL-2 family protein Ani s 5-like cation-binding domain-containing protein n=1 Tax=Diploscapter pachys TaxID=2018661 RepID=A0A2A2JG01_9BILA|nr:hypothetical protein WR25_18135 [Diploscapter pachys]
MLFISLLLLAFSALASSSPLPASDDANLAPSEGFFSHAAHTIKEIFGEENPQLVFSDVLKEMFNDESDRARRLQQLHEFVHKHHRDEQQQLDRHRHDSSDSGDMTARRYEDSGAATTKANETGVIRKEIDYLKQKYQGIRNDIDKWVVCEGNLGNSKPLDPHPDDPLHRWLRLNLRSVADIHPRQGHLLQTLQQEEGEPDSGVRKRGFDGRQDAE